MKEYYLHNGQNQIGPFSKEDLREQGISQESYVWKEGMADWVKAGEMQELNEIFKTTPPPFKVKNVNATYDPDTTSNNTNKLSVSEKTGTFIGRNPRLNLIIIIFLCIGGYAFYQNYKSNNNALLYNQTYQEREKTPEELRQELIQQEKQNPAEYLKAQITMRGNLLGEKVFEGTITNTASVATFKDAIIQFTFLSKTNTEIGSKSFPIYEIMKPQQTISIEKIKYYTPDGTENFNISIVKATPVD